MPLAMFRLMALLPSALLTTPAPLIVSVLFSKAVWKSLRASANATGTVMTPPEPTAGPTGPP